MNKIEIDIAITENEIGYLSQIIDVLDVLKNYDTIEQVREDVEKRKELYLNDIKDMKKRLVNAKKD